MWPTSARLFFVDVGHDGVKDPGHQQDHQKVHDRECGRRAKVELPKMQGVLLIAVLLRFMDSFMIYTEPFVVTGGGPGNATTFLSIDLVKMAIGQFDLGPAAAFSIMYFLVILLVSWVFYTVMTNLDKEEAR